MAMVQLGIPDDATCQWIWAHAPSDWDKITSKLESFNETTAPAAQGLPAPGSGLTVKYMVCDGYMNGSTFTQCLTKQSVMDNLDKIPCIETPMRVLGYNGTVPQYVKYKAGKKDIIYVSSVDDTVSGGLLRAITAGCKTYTRAWAGASLQNAFTDTGKTVSAVGADTFTYGQTNANWGTTATTAGGYSVPRSITVDGKTYAFAGYTMALETLYLMGSSTNGTSVTETTCGFSYDTSTSSSRNRWSDAHMRMYMNSFVGHNEITYPRVTPTANMLGFANGFGLKFAQDTDFLKNLAPSVTRRWVHTNWRSGITVDANGVEHCADTFFTMDNAAVNTTDGGYFYGDQYEGFAKFTTCYPVQTTGGSSTVKTDTLKKFALSTVGGTPATSAAFWWLGSTIRSYTNYVASVVSTGFVLSNYAYNALGLCAACSIY